MASKDKGGRSVKKTATRSLKEKRRDKKGSGGSSSDERVAKL